MTDFETIVPTFTYVRVCAVLALLTLLNIGLALVDLRGWNTVIELLIAAVQAVLSVLFLMRLRWTRPLTRLVGLIGLLWLAILIFGTMDDLLTRGWLPIPGK